MPRGVGPSCFSNARPCSTRGSKEAELRGLDEANLKSAMAQQFDSVGAMYRRADLAEGPQGLCREAQAQLAQQVKGHPMQQVGKLWLPDVDLRWWSHWGKTRRKTLARYGQGGSKTGDIKAALARIPCGGLAIDRGANVGVYGCITAGSFDRVVIAFEPAPDTLFACLARNLSDWGLAGRVEARAQALSDRTESVAMKSRRGHRTLSQQVRGASDILAVPIDDLGLPELAFLKRDLEGCEAHALRGAAETLARCRPFVLFEDKPRKAERNGQTGGSPRDFAVLGRASDGPYRCA